MSLLPPIRRLRPPVVEALETRIAPASVALVAGTGPFTLEVDPADSHLHITNNAGTEIFDQGGAVGDDLTITGAGVDDFNIHQGAGLVRFTGTLDVNIGGAIHVDGALQAQTLSLVTSTNITSSAAISGGTLSLFSAHGIALNAGVSGTGRVDLDADFTTTHTGSFVGNGSATITVSAGNLSIRGASLNPGAALTATSGNVSLIADAMNLTASVTAGGGTVNLRTESGPYSIHLGTETAGSLSLTDAELDQLKTTDVIVGDANTRDITIDAVLSPANFQNLSLGQQASFSSAGDLPRPSFPARSTSILRACRG